MIQQQIKLIKYLYHKVNCKNLKISVVILKLKRILKIN